MHSLVGDKSVSGEPHLAFIFPPILLCETSQGSEFRWIKTTKRKDTMIGQAEMDGDTAQTGNKSFSSWHSAPIILPSQLLLPCSKCRAVEHCCDLGAKGGGNRSYNITA